MNASDDGGAVGSIPVKDAIILWASDHQPGQRRKIGEVFVCHVRRQPAWTKRLHSSRGACDLDWLAGYWLETPMGTFLEMCAVGFVDDGVKESALLQFVKIRGQKWAVDLFRELTGKDLADV